MLYNTSGYTADSRTGCIYSNDILTEFNNLDKTKLDFLANMKYETKKNIAMRETNNIKTIFIHPVNKYCLGSCEYCYLNALDNHDKQQFDNLTIDRLDNFLSEIKPYLSTNGDLLFKFSGGSCFLHKDIYGLINICKKYDKKANIRFMADLLFSKTVYNRTVDILWQLQQDEDIKTVTLYISVDFGSDTRYSKYINIDSNEVKRRAEEIIDTFGHYSKFRIELKTNFSKYTDVDIMIAETKKFENKNCWLIFSPVRDSEYSADIKLAEKIMTELENNFNLEVLYMREILISNNYAKSFCLDMDNLDTSYIKLDKGLYIFNPHYSDCPGYLISSGVSTDKYLACYIGYLEEDNIKDTLMLKENNENYNKFINLPDECNDCEFLGVCNRCVPRRKMLSCNNIPLLKWWEKYIWEKRIGKMIVE